MLRVEGLTLSFGHNVLLENCSLACRPGEIVGLVAPNGYGKTTLLRALAGIGGSRACGLIALDEAVRGSQRELRRLVFYAPGDASLLYPNMSVRNHLSMVKRLWRSGIALDNVTDACALRSFMHKRVRACSQGMRQQLTIAIALMTGARYLLLDEPMNALDPTNVQRITGVLRCEASNGRCIVLSSHILDNVDRIADRVLFIHNRKVISYGEGQNVGSAYARYHELYERRS